MKLPIFRLLVGAALSVFVFAPPLARADEPTEIKSNVEIEVTATRVPEEVLPVDAAITVVGGEEIEQRGATDLPSALALATGVSVAPGGDGGPAGSVPEMWGLREFDAFLLVVDGVPWGGAFNPALPTLDLNGVDRIEILRGSAPVMYGATSFVGVIHVIHRAAGAPGGTFRAWGGNYGTWGASGSVPLSNDPNGWRQSVSANVEQKGFKDDRTDFSRGHLLYRGEAGNDETGRFRLDVDATFLRQSPASPHPRTGKVLTDLVPIDSNHNPSDGKIDEDRYHFVGGYDRKLSADTLWTTTLAFTHSRTDAIRGFLRDVEADPIVADGYRQEVTTRDFYFDSHLAMKLSPELQVVAGVDYLYGDGGQNSDNFEYEIGADGSGRPDSHDLHVDESTMAKDTRNFGGLYVQAEWMPTPAFRVEAGGRLNHTVEKREGESVSFVGDDPYAENQSESNTRGSGTVGLSYRVWDSGIDSSWVYANWRNTFKPAAVDFGPEAEAEILKPETAISYEAGVKGRMLSGRLEWDLGGFWMDMDNLVISQAVDGHPTLTNAGSERFKGIEFESSLLIASDMRWQLAYAWHDARFTDYLTEFDGVPTQLEGNRLEMSAKELASTGFVLAPPDGLTGHVEVSYVGERWLNKRNTAPADPYTTWSAGLGWRFGAWEARIDGWNLNDTRPPVAESEMGDAQYYLLPARSWVVSLGGRF